MKTSTSIDEETPVRAAGVGGDWGASLTFDDIYQREFPFVWRCLSGLGVSPAALDDAAQDVFLVVHRQLIAFRGQSSLRSWLFGIVRNVASNHRRLMRRKGHAVALPDDQPAPAVAGPHEQAQDAQAAAFVQKFLARISERKRDVFILAAIEGMTIPEVAAALSIPLNTAYTRLRSVRADFQRALLRAQGVRP